VKTFTRFSNNPAGRCGLPEANVSVDLAMAGIALAARLMLVANLIDFSFGKKGI